jgi:hypothetical protein
MHASAMTIGAIVCNSNSGAVVTVASPVSDSTVNQPTFLVSGSVTSATQIEVRIDDVYNSTISIGLSQTQFLFSVTLTQGTHTISLLANDVCAVHDGTANLVITFDPSIVPTPGSDVPTDTTPTLTPDGSAFVGNIAPGLSVPPAKASGVIVMPHSTSKTSVVASLPQQVIDESKPTTPSPIAPVVAAVPFVAGGGAAGFWWKWKLPRFHK